MRSTSYLLDTHIVLWMDNAPQRITADLRLALNAGELLYLSAASSWEAAIKRATGKMQMRAPLSEAARRFHLTELPVTAEHGESAATLPRHHGDPFDRLLVAQARIERLVLVTSDVRLQQYDVDLLLV